MPRNIETTSVEQLLAEADELIQQINSAAIKDKEEAIDLQLEQHVKKLEKIKSEALGKKEKKRYSGAEGMHAAIRAITKALGNLRKDLS
jgi:hypothetical protein